MKKLILAAVVAAFAATTPLAACDMHDKAENTKAELKTEAKSTKVAKTKVTKTKAVAQAKSTDKKI